MTARRLSASLAPTPEASGRPFYVRALRLHHLNPSSTLCFVFLEGATALAIILALAELIPLWGTVLLPLCIAAMVKINDLVAGAAVRAAATGPGGATGRRPMRPLRPFRTIGRATVPGGTSADKVGRVYRSSPAEASASTTPTAGPTDPSDPVETGQTATADHAGWPDSARPETDDHRVIHGAATPTANRATSVNAPPVDLHQGKAARTPTTRDWAADVFDTPAQRARHAATRRYE